MHGLEGVAIQYCLGFSGGIYGIYIILGYLVKKGKFKNVSSSKLWILAIVSFLICVVFQYYAFVINYDFFLWYEFPFILLGSFALFELCSRVKSVKFYSWVTIICEGAVKGGRKIMEMSVELFDSIINTSQDCVFWKDKG